MDSPPLIEPVLPFIESTKLLLAQNINVPKIHHQNIELGCLVLDDFGNRDYLSVLNIDNADRYYQQAIDQLIKLQQSKDPANIANFDEQHIRKELALFTDWYLTKHCQINSFDLQNTFNILIENCLAQPQVLIHRDFHSRNLMVVNDSNPGILDHQDLMLGPLSYDLVSLVKDCYIDWPEHKIGQWLDYYLTNSHYCPKDFYHAFELTGMQRHLKAIGIFARLAHLYDNPNYLKYIPRVLKYLQDVTDNNSKFNDLALVLKKL